MENNVFPSAASSHPCSYLTFLNKLYSVYQQDADVILQKNSKLKLQTKSFKKMDIPDVLFRNYMHHQSLLKLSNRKKVNDQSEEMSSRIWKQHAQSLQRFRRQVSKRREKVMQPASNPRKGTTQLQPHQNTLLKKLTKAGKIPSSYRQELKEEVRSNLRTLSSENKLKRATSRNIRTSDSTNRPKTRVLMRHPMAVKYENRQAMNRSRQVSKLEDGAMKGIGNKTDTLTDVWDSLSLEKQVQELRYFDASMSYKSVQSIQRFISKIHQLQSSIEEN